MEWRRAVWKNVAAKRVFVASPRSIPGFFLGLSSGRRGISVPGAIFHYGRTQVGRSVFHGHDRATSGSGTGFSFGNRLIHGCAGIFPRSVLDPSPALPCGWNRRPGSISPGIAPWTVQKRFMGGKRKSLARARKNFAKKVKKQIRAKQLSKRPRIPALDVHLRRETRMRMVWNVKLILASRDGHVIPSTEFTALARDLGFPKTKLFADFVNSFPGIFKISNDKEDRRVRWLEFTEEAEQLIDQEEKIMREYHEPLIVRNLRKILMMIPSRRVLLTKISHIRSSLWIPDNFKTAIIPKYPEFFTITGAYLELVAYDKSLAVTTRELKRGHYRGPGRYSFKICEEPHSVLRRTIHNRILSFQRLPFPSPYEHVDELDVRSPEGQKRVVAIFHEFLSLTVEKKAYVDHVGFFTRDLGLPQKLEDMLCRFPHIFYLSMKGDRHVVFLKEYYKNGRLVEKHPLFVVKQEFGRLMDFRVFRESRPREIRGICADSFVAPRQLPSETLWSFPAPEEPVKVDEFVEAATVVDTVKMENAPTKVQTSEDGAGSRSRSTILKKLGLFSDDERSDDEGKLSPNAPAAVPGEIFLQVGLDDEDQSPKDLAKPFGKQLSLGVKLGFCSDDDNSDDEKQQGHDRASAGDEDSWSWKEPQSRTKEQQLERKRKKRVPKPFWEKKPFDGFNDPFF